MEKAARTIERVANLLSCKADSAGRVVLVIMMLLITADVLLRYIFNRPIKGSFELVELMMVLVVFLGLAYAQVQKTHVAVDLFTRYVPPGVQKAVDAGTYLLCLGAYAVITWRSLVHSDVQRVEGTTSALLQLPVFPFMWIVAFGSALLSLTFLVSFLQSLSGAMRNSKKPWLWLSLVGIVVLLLVTLPVWLHWLPWEIDRIGMGLTGIVLLLLLLYSRMLIGPLLLIIGFLGFTYLVSSEASLSVLGMSPYRSGSSYTLSTLPLFMLMGMFCFYAGISADIYRTLHHWIGHFRGGLAMATVGACGGFAAVSGSSLATAVTMSTVALPEMRRYGYADSLACGCVAAGGTVGSLIPPSIAFIIYAQLTEQSIGRLFMAGVFPGILEVSVYLITIYILTKINPKMGPPGPRAFWKERFLSLKSTWAILVLFTLVMGGIYLGVFSPTESAAVGAFGALLIGLFKRKLNRKNFIEALADSARNTSMLFLMLIGAEIFGYFLTASRIPFWLAEFVVALQLPPMLALIAILIAYIILGCFMPIMGMIIITVPIFFPVIVAMGFDPIWYGVLMVMTAEMGVITPPVGMNVFAIAGAAKDVPTSTVFRGIIPFFIADIVRLVLVVAFPAIALWLPNTMKGG